MISSLRLKFGRAPGLPPQDIPVTPITVFVGPNNSGKSKILAEIQHLCITGQIDATAVLVDNINYLSTDTSDIESTIASITLAPRPGDTLHPGHVFVGTRGHRDQVPLSQFKPALANPSSNLPVFCQWFLRHSTLMLDGRSRIGLVAQQAAGDLQESPHSSFQVLFRDDAKRLEVRRIISEAFGTHFILDPTALGHLRIRLSSRPPKTVLEERGIHDEAVRFHAAAQSIDVSSDGVKAFTGIITEVIAGDPRVVLMDEPEAFLHPSLASKLGSELARSTASSNKRLFISTHSPQFVMGAIQAGVPINIIRLTYRDGTATARLLPSSDILTLMRNPLLRSTGVLSGLFYECVVVAESDADRAFYQEINDRLLRSHPDWGIPNCLFINAQNKQTVPTIVKPLRELGIPAAGIVDIDVLKDGGTVWTNALGGAFVPALSHQPLATMRAAVRGAMDATGKNMKRDGGTAILSGADREAAENLLRQLAEYGMFVVPGGELESWLKDLGASGHGPHWLIDVFTRMGEDPTAAGYVVPAADDVWAFIREIKGWLTDPGRKGIPD